MPDRRPWFKRLMPHLRNDLTVLPHLKQAGGVSFDAVSAGWYLQNGYPQIYSILMGGMPAWSGESVGLENALNHSVVWACNRLVSESIGFIPAVLHQKKAGVKREAAEHPMYSAMQDLPNDEISAQGFTELLTSHCLMQGNAFAQIIRRSATGTAIYLQHLSPQNVLIDREKGGAKRIVYEVKEPGAANKSYPLTAGKPQDIFHMRGLGWDGLRGYSVIHMGRQSIGTAIAGERHVARFWAHGGRVPYHLELAQKFKNDEDFQKFRDDWERIYSEPGRVPIAEPWLKYVPDGMSMREAQALESRLFTVQEICRWFNVSPHLVMDLSHATFSNVEHLALDFVKLTLTPWLWRWEQDFKRCVLTPEERAAGYYLRHNVRELLRGDFQSRMQGYATALQNGYMNIDEVRDEEDMNPLPNGAGENHHIQLNMQPVGEIGQQAQSKPEPKGIRRIA